MAAAQALLHVLVQDVAHAAQVLDLGAIDRRPVADRLDRDAVRQAGDAAHRGGGGHLGKRHAGVALREDRAALVGPVDDAGELGAVVQQGGGHLVERKGAGCGLAVGLDVKAGHVRGARGGEAALDGFDQRGLAAARELQGDRGVEAASVAGADAGVTLAPVALLGTRVEDQDVVAVALEQHRAGGPDDDDHAPGARQRLRPGPRR